MRYKVRSIDHTDKRSDVQKFMDSWKDLVSKSQAHDIKVTNVWQDGDRLMMDISVTPIKPVEFIMNIDWSGIGDFGLPSTSMQAHYEPIDDGDEYTRLG